MSKLITYLRVSTKQQGASGLGLEAQRAAVKTYADATGAGIDAEYVEVESGKRADRPKLAAALARARSCRKRIRLYYVDAVTGRCWLE